eukprot:COSAG01_NODE_4018_length_5397_cov_4.400488_2_plen_250_part_00
MCRPPPPAPAGSDPAVVVAAVACGRSLPPASSCCGPTRRRRRPSPSPSLRQTPRGRSRSGRHSSLARRRRRRVVAASGGPAAAASGSARWPGWLGACCQGARLPCSPRRPQERASTQAHGGRVRVEIMQSPTCRIVGTSQSGRTMTHPSIFTRTRSLNVPGSWLCACLAGGGEWSQRGGGCARCADGPRTITRSRTLRGRASSSCRRGRSGRSARPRRSSQGLRAPRTLVHLRAPVQAGSERQIGAAQA